MNPEIKELLLKLKSESRDFRLAFSIKANKTKLVTDRVCIVLINKKIDEIMYIINLMTQNQRIHTWVKDTYLPGKSVFVSYTEDSRKIYIERLKGLNVKDQYFNRSIEWNIHNEDGFFHRNYTFGPRDFNEFKEKIPPELIPYLNFNHCLIRTDGNIYIRHRVELSDELELNPKIGRSIIKMLIDLQKDLIPSELDINIKRMIEWLRIHESRNASFNWVQISKDTLTLYVA